MTKDPRRLGQLLGEGRLGALRNEALRRRTATVDLSTRLDAEEARHVVQAFTREDGGLVVVADSAAWAARLRYRAVALGFPSVEIKVQPR